MQQENNEYIAKFSGELYNFLVFMNELMPIEATEKIIEKYPKINMIKIITRYRNIMKPLKDKIVKHDPSIFKQSLFIIPEFNLSFFWRNLPDDKKERVWKCIMTLLICSDIILDNQTHSVSTDKTPEQPKVAKVEINPYMGVGGDTENISVGEINNELNNISPLEGNPIMNMLKDKINTEEITKQLGGLDKPAISKMTNDAKKMLMSNIDDPQVSNVIGGLLNGIGDEMCKTNLSDGNILDTIMNITEKLSDKMKNDVDANNCPPEKLLASAQSIMKGLGLPQNLNPADLSSSNPTQLLNLLSSMTGGKKDDTMTTIVGMMNTLMKK